MVNTPSGAIPMQHLAERGPSVSNSLQLGRPHTACIAPCPIWPAARHIGGRFEPNPARNRGGVARRSPRVGRHRPQLARKARPGLGPCFPNRVHFGSGSTHVWTDIERVRADFGQIWQRGSAKPWPISIEFETKSTDCGQTWPRTGGTWQLVVRRGTSSRTPNFWWEDRGERSPTGLRNHIRDTCCAGRCSW